MRDPRRPMPMRDIKAAIQFCNPRWLPVLLYQLQALWREDAVEHQRTYRRRREISPKELAAMAAYGSLAPEHKAG